MRATAMPKARPTQFELIQPGRRMRQVGNSSFFATKAARHLNCPLLLSDFDERLCWNAEPLMQSPDHFKRERSLPIEHLMQQEWAV